jgi:hypothetical protein
LYNGPWCPHHRGAPAVENALFPGGGQSPEGTLTVRMPILRTWKHSSAQVYPTVNGQPRIRAACTVASRRFLGQSPVGIPPHQRKSSRLRGKGSRPFHGQGWLQGTIATPHVLLLPFIPPDCEIWQQVMLGKATTHGLLPKVELKGSQGAHRPAHPPDEFTRARFPWRRAHKAGPARCCGPGVAPVLRQGHRGLVVAVVACPVLGRDNLHR